MSDEKEQPPPDQKTLEYWHSSERPVTSLRLALSFTGGFLLSSTLLFVVVGICGAMSGNTGAANGNIMLQIGLVTWGTFFIGSIIILIGFSRVHRQLPIEERRQPQRYFELGALIGFGLAALLGGICFGLAGR